MKIFKTLAELQSAVDTPFVKLILDDVLFMLSDDPDGSFKSVEEVPEELHSLSFSLGGYLHLCESVEDLNDAKDGNGRSILSEDAEWDVAKSNAVDGLAFFVAITNNSGGNAFYVPRALWSSIPGGSEAEESAKLAEQHTAEVATGLVNTLAQEPAPEGVNVTMPIFGGTGTRTLLLPTTQARIDAWRSGGDLIQNALPELNADQREFLLTGMLPEEWGEFLLTGMLPEEWAALGD